MTAEHLPRVRSLVLAAQTYYELGFNALPLSSPNAGGPKHPNIPWKGINVEKGKPGFAYQDYTRERFRPDDIEAHSDRYQHGIVGITGISDYHSIDLDHIEDWTILEEVLAHLELPPDYAWVVLSGSGNGAQIWFHCAEGAEEIAKGWFDYSARDSDRFDHMELRWRGNCCVLPPSRHPSGGSYRFKNIPWLPDCPPATVSLEAVKATLAAFGELRNPGKEEQQSRVAKEKAEYRNLYERVKARLTVLTDNGMDAEVVCPWASEHTDGRKGAHIWYNDGVPGFSCLHAHCSGRRWWDVVDALQLRIILGRQLNEEVEDILKALYADNHPPFIFIRGGRLARIGHDEEGQTRIEPIDEKMMLARISQAAIFKRWRGGEIGYVATHPAAKHAALTLAWGNWQFPALKAIVGSPVLRPDGTILDTPGYDPVTHLYHAADPDLAVPSIPTRPTQEDAKRAANYLLRFDQDFPFLEQTDRANALALDMTPFIRPLVRHVPLAIMTATKAGAGKGLRADKAALIATGRPARTISEVRNEEEWDKRLTAALLENSASFIDIDNVEGVLNSAVLSKTLTSDTHYGRILGLSKMVTVNQRATWVATGNNVQLGGDLPRRCYPIRLQVQVSNPWEREDIRDPDLLGTVLRERGKIIAAILTMVRAWWVAGRPAPEKPLKRMATFSQWVDVIGGVLSYAGVDGFLENLPQMYERSDVDGKAWATFLQAWREKLGEAEYTTARLIEEWRKDAELAATLPDPIGGWFVDDAQKHSRKIGKALAKKNGVPFGPNNLRLVQAEDSHSKVSTFKVAGLAGLAGLNALYAKNTTGPDEEEKREYGWNQTPQTPQTPQSIPG